MLLNKIYIYISRTLRKYISSFYVYFSVVYTRVSVDNNVLPLLFKNKISGPWISMVFVIEITCYSDYASLVLICN